MAKGEDINVVVGNMVAPKSEVDVKYDRLPKFMTKGVAEALSKQKGFSVKKSATGLKSGYIVNGSIISLKEETRKGQQMVVCVVNLDLAEIPKGFLRSGKLEGTGGTSLTGDLQGDAEFAAEAAAKEAVKMAVKQIEHAESKK